MVPSSHGHWHLQRTVGHETAGLEAITYLPQVHVPAPQGSHERVQPPHNAPPQPGEGRGAHQQQAKSARCRTAPAHTHSASSAGQPPEMPNSASERS